MLRNTLNKSDYSYCKTKEERQDKVKKLIIEKVERATGLTIDELKRKYPAENRFFYEALKYVTSTKKAICKALDVNIDNACRDKRRFEKRDTLAQSKVKVRCPYTLKWAHLISSNPEEFEGLEELENNKSNQLTMF